MSVSMGEIWLIFSVENEQDARKMVLEERKGIVKIIMQDRPELKLYLWNRKEKEQNWRGSKGEEQRENLKMGEIK